MKLQFVVDSYLAIPHDETDFSSGNLKQYLINVPIVHPSINISEVGKELPFTAELSINFRDNYKVLYKWDNQKSQWVKQDGRGLKNLKFPIPILTDKQLIDVSAI